MAFEIPKQPYSGKIGETTIGTGPGALKVGGEDSYPFYVFEGSMPNPPKIAMEVWDYDPSNEWPAAAVEPFKDVISSPEAWAKKCVADYGADLIVLQLKSIDPNGMDRSPEEAAQVAKKVSDAVAVPLVFWGTANNQKDEAVLKKIAEKCEAKNVALAPVEEGNHKGVGASALGYGQCIVASSPIDVNLAKQLNILLGNLGVQSNKILIDPTTGGLGYGLEYSYSVMERIQMAALTQEDDKLQVPLINNIGNEIWNSKEAGLNIADAPTLGDPEKRGILMESVAAVCYLLAGSDIVVLRHPESVRLVRSFIGLELSGGMAMDVAAIKKNLPMQQADLAAIAPQPDLQIGEATAEAKEKPKAAPKPEAKETKAAPTPAAAPAPEKKAAPAPAAPSVEDQVKAEAKAKAEAEAEAAAKMKTEAEAKAKADAAAKAKAEADAAAKAKAEAEAEAKAKAEAEAKTKEKEELQALRYKRAQEREKAAVEHKTVASGQMAAAREQLSQVDRMIATLDRIHKR